jgi:N-acetylmuramoyl-L-alanine amidase
MLPGSTGLSRRRYLIPARFASGLVLLLLVGFPAAGFADVTVDRIRHWSGPEHTRVVLDLSGSPVYRDRRTADPPAVTLEVDALAAAGIGWQAIGDGRLQTIAVEPRAEGGLKITFALAGQRAVKVFTLEPGTGKPYRIVVDVLGAPSSGTPPPPTTPAAPPPAEPTPAPAAPGVTITPERGPSPPGPGSELPAGGPSKDPAPMAAPPAEPAVSGSRTESAPAAAPAVPAGSQKSSPTVTDTSALAAAVRPRPAPRSHPWVVVVDPGHGGEDPGAKGPGGVLEKNLCLALSRALVADLNRRPGIRAHLTRDEDVFLPLRRRTRIAAEKSADLFVSVHANSSRDKTVRGTEVYFLSLRGASVAGAREVAMRENAADLVAGVPPAAQDDIEEILLDLMRTKVLERSSEMAATVIDGLQADKNLVLRGVKQAGFDVLKTASMPSILVETAFISHSKEAKMMKTKAFQERFGKLVGGALAAYLARVGATDQAPPATPAAASPPVTAGAAGS